MTASYRLGPDACNDMTIEFAGHAAMTSTVREDRESMRPPTTHLPPASLIKSVFIGQIGDSDGISCAKSQ